MTVPNALQHPASVDAYIRHGWSLVPIPPGTKGPATDGWNRREQALMSSQSLPSGWGIGLAHAYSGTMALDIDSWDRAAFQLMLQGVDLQALYDAPDAVIIDSGRQGHGKLLYKMPEGLVLPQKKLIVKIDGKDLNYLDFRCGTANGLTVQDVLPPSIHPDTHQPYRWAGRGHWMRLPVIPDALLNVWQGLIGTDTPNNTTPMSAEQVSWEQIISALECISADLSRAEWVQVGMALHYAGAVTGQMEYAFKLWDAWSARSLGKYPGTASLTTQWKSFRTDKGVAVTLGTLFHLARESGWVSPVPDVAGLFPDMIKPAVFTAALRPEPPNLNLDLFPEILARRAQEISDGVGCDPLVPLFAGLGAVCGAIDARTRLELMPDFQVPPVLWLMTIGEPADKKTPGSAPMFGVLREIEAEDRPRYAKERIDYEVAQARYETAKKQMIEHMQTPESLLENTVVPAIPPEPAVPVATKLIVQDITSQKLVRQCADRPRGLLCYLDEMAAWAEKVSDTRSGEDRSAWTVAYEARWYEMDRVGAGTISASNFALSIFGNIQPQVMQTYAAQLSKDGLLQRFIPVVLRPKFTRLGHPVPECMTSKSAYDQMVRVVYGLPPVTYHLSPEALTIYREFQAWYEQAKHDERITGALPTYMTAFGKIEGLAGRVALVWHCVETPYSMQVSGTLMTRVITFMKDYVIPTLRYVHQPESGDSFDKWLADHVIFHCDIVSHSLADLKHSSRVQLKHLNTWQQDQAVIGAMMLMEEAGWVVRVDDGSMEHRHMAQWAVNPGLKDQFTEYRREVVEAKQRLSDSFYRRTNVKPKPVKGNELLYGTDLFRGS